MMSSGWAGLSDSCSLTSFLFSKHRIVTSNELASYLGLSPRQGRDQCAKWVTEDFLMVANASKKGRSYQLVKRFEGAVAE